MNRFLQNNRNNSGRMVQSPSMRRAKIVLIITVLLLMIGFLVFAPMTFSGAARDAIIKIPKNASESQVRDSLTKYLGHKFAERTMTLLSMRKIDYAKRYGAYEITEGMSPFNAMRRLGSGGQEPIDITINGFRSMDVLVNRVASKLDITPRELKAAATDSATLAHYGLKPEQAMALFLDDTYEVYWTTSAKDVVKKIGDNYEAFWNSSRRGIRAKRLGLTPAEAVTICSIVDEETLDTREKGRIGRLYLNRLGAGMKLQADPTVRYALHDFTIRRVLDKHLNYDSPYNTYKYAGLPPGPIRTTGRVTIDAFLNSAPTSDLYMCAKEDFSGTHNFASNYEEHLANAARYQKALDQRGIK